MCKIWIMSGILRAYILGRPGRQWRWWRYMCRRYRQRGMCCHSHWYRCTSTMTSYWRARLELLLLMMLILLKLWQSVTLLLGVRLRLSVLRHRRSLGLCVERTGFPLPIAKENLRFMTMKVPMEIIVTFSVTFCRPFWKTVLLIPTAKTPAKIQWKPLMLATIFRMTWVL